MKRYVLLLGVAAAALAVAVVAVVVIGRGDHRSVLYSGVSSPLGTHTSIVTDAAATQDGRTIRADWLARLGNFGPTGEAGAVTPQQFHSRLTRAADQYGFVVKRVELTHRSVVAPLVVVQTARYIDFARAIPAIESSLDPHSAGDDRRGWAFRGFFLEAQDERGVPFAIVNNFEPGGGGQWARADELYPFPHG
jgi:hypothetical protein